MTVRNLFNQSIPDGEQVSVRLEHPIIIQRECKQAQSKRTVAQPLYISSPNNPFRNSPLFSNGRYHIFKIRHGPSSRVVVYGDGVLA